MKYLSAFRCAGREVDQGRCCSEAAPCVAGEGDCDGDQECEAGLVCGDNNCRQVGDQSEAFSGTMDQSEACSGVMDQSEASDQYLSILQFGAFFHEKDDCCVKPKAERNPAANSIFGNWLLLSRNKLHVV